MEKRRMGRGLGDRMGCTSCTSLVNLTVRVRRSRVVYRQAVQNNGSLYLDVFMVYSSHNTNEKDRPDVPHGGFNFDGSRGEHRPAEWVHTRKLLTRYMPQRKQRTTKKLLSSSSTAEPSAEEEEEDSLFAKAPRPVVSFYHPNVSVEVVCDSGALPYHTLPPAIKSNIQLARQKTYDGKDAYLPPVYVNDFWLLKGVSPPVSLDSLTRI